MEKQVLTKGQMQHLSDLGLCTSDASALYYCAVDGETQLMWKEQTEESDWAGDGFYSIPAYTISDIISLLPPATMIAGFSLGWRVMCVQEGVSVERDGYNLIDALYSVLCLLIEGGVVKTGKGQ